MAIRQSLARTGGAIAVVFSALWTLLGAGVVVFGVLLFFSDDRGDPEGFLRGFGGGLAFIGALVVAGAVGGILLGIRFRRGGGGRLGLILLFGLFALVSGSFLASSIADETGVNIGGVVGFGLNTALCLAVMLSAVVGARGTAA